MTILTVHNYYQNPGGEDVVFQAEADLLESRGHRVLRYSAHNDSIAGLNPAQLLVRTVWNRHSYEQIRTMVKQNHVDVCHFHNTFPVVSPAAYYAARAGGAAVVQTLHNYRLICPGATLYRDGRVCLECIGTRSRWPGVLHGCYRDSRPASGATALMTTLHRSAGTWQKRVDSYIAINEFSRDLFVRGGLPPERIHVKPNFVREDPGPGSGDGGFALFAGRLTVEKGIRTLLAAWKQSEASISLKIAGDGPLREEVLNAAGTCPAIDYLGPCPPARVTELMGATAFLIVASEWYETGPLTIIEAFARGTPVIAPALGGMSRLVEDGRTGIQFRAGDAAHLAEKIAWAAAHPDRVRSMRPAARAEYEDKFTPDRNYQQLLDIYAGAITRSRSAQSHTRSGEEIS
jgi:glycosyltransferase involved in cell wall biosynthesis